ncbi:MAG: P-loop NTPase [Candidatus Thorarchaeota archaeon]
MASGKGGTGKTTIAVNLALHIAKSSKVALFDLDVEEPNDNHFLRAPMTHFQDVTVQRPVINELVCSHCGLCADLCEFNALAVLPNQVMIFNELCHGCGLCSLACPEEAITEEGHSLGVIRKSNNNHGNLMFFEGILRVGEALATPIIHELKKIALKFKNEHVILDLPPGSACPVIEALSGTDYAVLVTEPTPAGEHDLLIAIDLVKKLKIPFGIINNRSNVGDDRINRLTADNGYNLLLEIPHDKEILHLYSNGLPLIGITTKFDNSFSNLWNKILENKK